MGFNLKGIVGRALKHGFISKKRRASAKPSPQYDDISELENLTSFKRSEEEVLSCRNIVLDNPLPEQTKILHVSYSDETRPDNIQISSFEGLGEEILAEFFQPPNTANFIQKKFLPVK